MSVNRGHGLDRAAVASSPALARSPAASRRSRPTVARCASRTEWNSLGFAHRCSLARSARPLSALSNLSSPFSAVAASWHPFSPVVPTRRRPASTRKTRSFGDVHRRQFQFGEKGGGAVGRLAEEKGARSWRLQTAMVFLSPAASPALRRMKQNSSKPLSSTVSHGPNHHE